MWVVQCDCGTKRAVIAYDLQNGKSKSCGGCHAVFCNCSFCVLAEIYHAKATHVRYSEVPSEPEVSMFAMNGAIHSKYFFEIWDFGQRATSLIAAIMMARILPAIAIG